MAKHLIDIDEESLEEARAELGTITIKDTVNTALRRTRRDRRTQVADALDVLAAAPVTVREDAWR